MDLKENVVHRLFLIMTLQGLFANFAHPITPTIIQNLELNDYMFGVAFACMSITNFLFSPFWGKISKNIGSSKVIGICFIGYGFAQALFGISTSEISIIMARLLAGFFIGGLTVNEILYIMKYSKKEDKGSNLAISVTITTVLSAFGYMIGGILGDYSIALTFTLQSLGLMLIGVLALFILKEDILMDRIDKVSLIKESNPFKVIWDAREMMSFIIVVFLVITMTTSFASVCYEQCFNYFIREQYGFPPSYNGLLKALVGFVTLLANSTICIWLLKKTDIKKSIIPVFIICFFMMVSIILLEDLVPFIIMNVVFFAFNAIYQPLLQTMVGQFTVKDSGVLVGVYNSMRSFGQVAGSLFAGFIYGIGPRLSFVYSAFAFMIAIVFAIIFNIKSNKYVKE